MKVTPLLQLKRGHALKQIWRCLNLSTSSRRNVDNVAVLYFNSKKDGRRVAVPEGGQL